MNKKIFLVIFTCIFLIACKKAPVKERKGNYVVKTEVREKIESNYHIFKERGLPLPPNNYGDKIDYLIAVNDNFDEKFSLFKKYNEEKVLKFYKNTKIRGNGDHSSYWRWKTATNKNELYSRVAKKLIEMSKKNRRNVFTLVENEWKNQNLTNVGSVKEIVIAARGASGIITHLLIITSNGQYLVTKDYNIRQILATNSGLYGAKGGTDEYIATPIVPTVVSLPSAYFAIEEKGKNIIIYGGGYGHGAGMPQFAAASLAKDGENYKKILKRYYANIDIVNMKKIIGKERNIKVGITSSASGSLEHSNLNIISGGKLEITNRDIDLKLKENSKVKIVNKSGALEISLANGKKYRTESPLSFYAEGYYLTLSPVRKGHTSSPKYRGIITIYPSGNKNLRVINTVDIEKYLLQVVPSEMPMSFGLEALKAQAVAARTYAISDILKGKYKKDGFHIKDTVESQVYNNQVENDIATKAIEETEEKIMIHKDKPVDAKYFSTSSGFTSFANDIW